MLKALFPWKHNKTKVMAAEQTMDNDATLQPQDFFPCHVCGRTFLLKPLKRHEKVCEKNAAKKRRVFDSLKQRVEGTDLAPFHQKVYLKKPQETTSPPKPPSKWKEKHLELVNAIRAAKGVVSDPSSTSLSTKKSTNAFMAGNERCPSCERQFGPKAFDRHVEWCKERKTRIQHSPANVLLAKERLEARTKYKVPPLNKSKRTITKEKYSNSPSSDTKITTRTTPSTPILQRGPSIRKPKSLVTLGKIGDQIEEKYQIKEKRTGRENQKEVVPALPLLKSNQTQNKKRTLLPPLKINTPQVNDVQLNYLTVSSLKCPSRSIGKKTSSNDNSNRSVGSKSGKFALKSRSVECEKILSSDDVLIKDKLKIPCVSSENLFVCGDGTNITELCQTYRATNTEVASDDSISSVFRKISENDLSEINVLSGISPVGDSCDSLLAKAVERIHIDSRQNLKSDSENDNSRNLKSAKCNSEKSKYKIVVNTSKLNKGSAENDTTVEEAVLKEELEESEKTNLKIETSLLETSAQLNENRLQLRQTIDILKDCGYKLSEIKYSFPGAATEDLDYSSKTSLKIEEIDEETGTLSENNVNPGPSYRKSSAETEKYFNCEESATKLKEEVSNSKIEGKEKFENTESMTFKEESEEITKTKEENLIFLFQSKPSPQNLNKNDSTQLNSKASTKNTFVIKNASAHESDSNVSFSHSEPSLASSETLAQIPSNLSFVEGIPQAVKEKTSPLSTSLPNLDLTKFVPQTDSDTKSNETEEALNRHEILKLAANEFIQDFYSEEDKRRKSCLNFISLPLLDEEYTVPKKRRKFIQSPHIEQVDDDVEKSDQQDDNTRTTKYSVESHQTFSNVFNENAMGDFRKESMNDSCINTIGSSEEFLISSGTISVSSAASSDENYSPRLITLFKKMLRNFKTISNSSEDNETVLELTRSDCQKLMKVDENKIVQIVENVQRKEQMKRLTENASLPSISSGFIIQKVVKDKEVADKSVLTLPELVCKNITNLNYCVNCRKEQQMSKIPLLHKKQLLTYRKKFQDKLMSSSSDLKNDISGVYLDYGKSTETSHYDPIETAQRQFMELLECDDFKPFTSNTSKILHTPRPNTTSKVPPKKSSPSLSKKSIKSASPPNNKRSSIIDPPISFKDSTESFEDDFELLENLINENYTDDNKITTISEDFLLNLKDKFDNNNVGNDDDNNSLINLEQIFRSSNNRKYSDDSTIIIDPSLINENDNLSIPEHFHSSASPTSTIDTDITIQNDDDIDGFNPIDLSTSYHHQFETKKTTDNAQKPVIKRSISLSSRTKIDKEKSPPKLIRSISSKSSNSNLNRISKKAITKSTTKSINKSIDCSVVGSNGNRNDEKKKSMSPSMKTLFVPPSPKPPSMKNRHDIINYLTEQDTKISAKSDGDHEVNLKKESSYIEEPLKPEDLFHVDDEMYEEYKKYEEMYLKEMEEKKITKKHRQKTETNYGLLTASEEDETNKLNKIANDSAYGRKTQKRRGKTSKLSPLEQKNSIDSTSSSGSENNPGSPAIITSHQEQNQRLSKFCHECGNKYPLTTAKFCVECGVRRLVL